MTYNVCRGTLNLAQLQLLHSSSRDHRQYSFCLRRKGWPGTVCLDDW